MLRLRDGQLNLWEEILPQEVRILAPELATIDRLLDDDRFLAPFEVRFACRKAGRRSRSRRTCV